MELFWLFAVAALGVGGLLFWNFRQEKKRRESLRGASRKLGLEYEEKAGDAFLGRFDKLPLFGRGRRRVASNVMRGDSDGLPVTLFDYRYTVGGGKNSQTHHQLVATFEIEGAELPLFELRPENVLHKIGSKFGFQDIDFDHRPEFSGAYLLRGPDESAVRSLFSSSVMRFFERGRGWSVETDGSRIVAYRHRKRARPDDLREFLQDSRAVVRTISSR